MEPILKWESSSSSNGFQFRQFVNSVNSGSDNGGGQNNKVCAGTNHSSIFGGFCNAVSGNCSAILGGANNSDGGFSNVFIAGTGIALSATVGNANSLHANNLWLQPSVYFCYGGIAPGSTFTTGTVYANTTDFNALYVQM